MNDLEKLKMMKKIGLDTFRIFSNKESVYLTHRKSSVDYVAIKSKIKAFLNNNYDCMVYVDKLINAIEPCPGEVFSFFKNGLIIGDKNSKKMVPGEKPLGDTTLTKIKEPIIKFEIDVKEFRNCLERTRITSEKKMPKDNFKSFIFEKGGELFIGSCGTFTAMIDKIEAKLIQTKERKLVYILSSELIKEIKHFSGIATVTIGENQIIVEHEGVLVSKKTEKNIIPGDFISGILLGDKILSLSEEIVSSKEMDSCDYFSYNTGKDEAVFFEKEKDCDDYYSEGSLVFDNTAIKNFIKKNKIKSIWGFRCFFEGLETEDTFCFQKGPGENEMPKLLMLNKTGPSINKTEEKEEENDEEMCS